MAAQVADGVSELSVSDGKPAKAASNGVNGSASNGAAEDSAEDDDSDKDDVGGAEAEAGADGGR